MKNVVKKQQGFTLLELVVVVAVLGLIASMATEFVAQETNQNRHEVTLEKRKTLRAAVREYYKDCDDTLPPNLEDLVKDNSTCSGTWRGPYLLDAQLESCEGGTPANRYVFRDGWGNGFCTTEAADAALFKNFGWGYVVDVSESASSALSTYGLDGPSGSGSDQYEINHGAGIPFTTTAYLESSLEPYYLEYTVSGGVASLQCYDGSGVTTTITNCQSN